MPCSDCCRAKSYDKAKIKKGKTPHLGAAHTSKAKAQINSSGDELESATDKHMHQLKHSEKKDLENKKFSAKPKKKSSKLANIFCLVVQLI